MVLSFLLIMFLHSELVLNSEYNNEEIGELTHNKTRVYSFEANEEQLELIRGLYGQNISKGEFYEIVCPEVLEFLDEETKDDFYKREVKWSNLSGQPDSMSSSLVFLWE